MGTPISRRAALVGGGAAIAVNVPSLQAISMVSIEHPDYFTVSGHVSWFCERWGLGSIRGKGPDGERMRDLVFTPPFLEATGHTTTRMGTRVSCIAKPVPHCLPQVVRILSIDAAPDPFWEQSYLVDIIGYDLRTERLRSITSETDQNSVPDRRAAGSWDRGIAPADVRSGALNLRYVGLCSCQSDRKAPSGDKVVWQATDRG